MMARWQTVYLLPLIMIAALGVLVGGTLSLLAYFVLRPPRMTDGKAVYLLQRLSPGDLGMEFEPTHFTVRDERSHETIDLAAWWIPHPAGGDRTVILIHGYADAKVGSIAWAPVWRELGFHILAIDLRAHGESTGRFSTAGVFERHDLDQVLNQLHQLRPNQTRQLVLFGASLGAIIALATSSIRSDIAAVVLESPLTSFESGIRSQIELLGLPLGSMTAAVIRVASWMSGADLNSIQPLELLAAGRCPTLVIESGDDPFVSTSAQTALESAVLKNPRGSCWKVDGAWHLMALAKDPDGYERHLREFLANIPQMIAPA